MRSSVLSSRERRVRPKHYYAIIPIAMFIFLYGPDEYRRLEKKHGIVADFRKKHPDLGPALFDLAAEGPLDALFEFIKNQSIFESAKLAVLENAFETDAERLAKVLKPFVAEKNTTILISEREKPVKALAFLIGKPSLAQKFENLDGAEWHAFIKTEAKKVGLNMSDSAAAFLGMIYEGNSWALVTELQKLSALKGTGARGATIEKKDLDALDLEAAPNYWALINGMKSYDARIRLAALERLFATNDPPPKIFNILAAQAGPNIPRMAEYDLAVKSGKLEYEEALLDLILI